MLSGLVYDQWYECPNTRIKYIVESDYSEFTIKLDRARGALGWLTVPIDVGGEESLGDLVYSCLRKTYYLRIKITWKDKPSIKFHDSSGEVLSIADSNLYPRFSGDTTLRAAEDWLVDLHKQALGQVDKLCKKLKSAPSQV